MAMATIPASAQQTAANNDVESVTVTGLITSLQKNLDIKRDAQGLYQLTGRNTKLMVDLMAYFRQRNEDSIDL